MKVNISYSDYLTPEGKDKIDKISIELETNKLLEFSIVSPVLETDPVTCNIKMIDNTTVSEVSSSITKEDFTELMALVRKISGQF